MIRNSLVLIFILVSFLAAQIHNNLQWSPLAPTDWPMTRHDPQLTGRSPYIGPQSAVYIEKKYYPSGIFSGPVIGYNNLLYWGNYHTSRDNFNCATRIGNIIWTYTDPGTAEYSGPILMAADSTIIVAASAPGNLFAFRPNGTLKWSYHVSYEIMIAHTVVNINRDSTVYIVGFDSTIHALRLDGTLKWKVKSTDRIAYSAPAIAPDGNRLYIAGSDSNVYAYTATGELAWTYRGSTNKHYQVLVDSAGNIYYQHHDPQHYLMVECIRSDGTRKWIFKDTLTSSNTLGGAGTLDSKGNYYLYVNDGSTLCSIDDSGNLRWRLNLDPVGEVYEQITQPLICDKLGTIFFGSTNGKYYYAVSSAGTLLWKIPLDGYQVDNTGAISNEGIVYVATHNSNAQGMLLMISDQPMNIEHSSNGNENDYRLEQNYPNPFNSSTVINYRIPRQSFVSIIVYDILGKVVQTLVNEEKTIGTYSVKLDASSLSGQVYFYTMRSGNYYCTRKFILLK